MACARAYRTTGTAIADVVRPPETHCIRAGAATSGRRTVLAFDGGPGRARRPQRHRQRRKVTDKAVLVLDFFRREELQEGQESNLMEIGMLYPLSERLVLGAALARDSVTTRPTRASPFRFNGRWGRRKRGNIWPFVFD